ncbi:pyridoxamine 5'-phosphate oxidase family protein [Lentzea sp. NPDC051838]|uniref:pyridoxamine 5'-phosphate oxidase family protein n=1 Tax=Lentzea sp. NPDC051838 TaxID=3154849 RepID=UPI003446B401
MSGPTRHLHQLSTSAAMHKLDGSSFGRMVFSHQALPAIRLVNHVVDGNSVVIRVGVDLPPEDLVLTYEADQIDQHTWLGWCVVVTGMADRVVNAAEVQRFERILPLWAHHDAGADQLLRIQAQFVDGFEVRAGAAAA